MRLLTQITLDQMKETDALEAKYYGQDHIAGWEISWQWYSRFPWMSRFIQWDETIVAFVDFFPITWNYYHQLISGERSTDDMLESDILDISTCTEGEYPLILLTVVVDREYRGKGCLHNMFSDLFQYYDSLQRQGLRFGQVVTENVTDQGCRFSESMGFQPVNAGPSQGSLYTMSYQTFKENWMGK